MSNLGCARLRGEFERLMVDHPISPICFRPALARNNFRAGSQGERRLHLRHANLEATEAINDHARLPGIKIQVASHREFLSTLQMFEHSNHLAILRDYVMACARTQAVENGPDERILEALRDHSKIGKRVSCELAQPLEIRIVQTKVDHRPAGIRMARVQLATFKARDTSGNRLAKIRGPKELEHRARKSLIAAHGNSLLLFARA